MEAPDDDTQGTTPRVNLASDDPPAELPAAPEALDIIYTFACSGCGRKNGTRETGIYRCTCGHRTSLS
jgi:hypothetical protein